MNAKARDDAIKKLRAQVEWELENIF